MNKEQFDNLKKGQHVAIIVSVEQKNDEHQTIRTNFPGMAGWISSWIPRERLQPVGLELLQEASEYMYDWDGHDLQDAIHICRYLSSLHRLPEKSHIPLTLGLWKLLQQNGTNVGDNEKEIKRFCTFYEDDIQRLLSTLSK